MITSVTFIFLTPFEQINVSADGTCSLYYFNNIYWAVT